MPRGLGAGDSGCLSISTITAFDYLLPSAPALTPDNATENGPSQVVVLPAPQAVLGRALLSAPEVYEEGAPGSPLPSQVC